MENTLEGFLNTYKFFHNPLEAGKAGTFIAIRRSFLDNFDYEEEILVPGYIQQVILSPKEGSDSLPFSLINVYLYTGEERWATVEAQLRAAMEGRSCDFNFSLGDFNLTFEKDDYSGSLRTTPQSIRDTYVDFLSHFHLREAPQPLHTWFSNHRKKPNSSKLDRVLTPDVEAYLLVFNPVSRVLPPPLGLNRKRLSPSTLVDTTTTGREASWTVRYPSQKLM